MIEKISKMISNLKVLSKMNDIIDGLNTHTTNTNNPHNVTAEQLGLATAYVYKGSVENFSELPTDAQNGWVYSVKNEYIDSFGNVHPAGSNFAWNGSRWDDLGGSLSRYTTLDFLEDRLAPITNQVNTNKTNIEDLQNDVDTLNIETIPTAVNKAETAATNAQNAANSVKKYKALWFDSVAVMKAEPSLTAGAYVCTAGYYTPNDGGGASYLIRAKADSDVDDGGSIHELSNGLVAELIVENGTVNVKQVGIKGNDRDSAKLNTILFRNIINKNYKIDISDVFYFDISTDCKTLKDDINVILRSNSNNGVIVLINYDSSETNEHYHFLKINKLDNLVVSGIKITSEENVICRFFVCDYGSEWHIKNFVFEKNIVDRVNMFYADAGTSLNPLETLYGIDRLFIQNNDFKNTAYYPTFTFQNSPVRYAVVAYNKITNFDSTFYDLRITNEHPYANDIAILSRYHLIQNNVVVEEEEYSADVHGSYHCFVLLESNIVDFKDNVINGIKYLGDISVETYYFYISSNVVNINGNRLGNLYGKTNSRTSIFMCKSGVESQYIERNYSNNIVRIEASFLENVCNAPMAGIYFSRIQTRFDKTNIENNRIEVPRLVFEGVTVTFPYHNVYICNNEFIAEQMAGCVLTVKTDSNSGNDTQIISNNTFSFNSGSLSLYSSDISGNPVKKVICSNNIINGNATLVSKLNVDKIFLQNNTINSDAEFFIQSDFDNNIGSIVMLDNVLLSSTKTTLYRYRIPVCECQIGNKLKAIPATGNYHGLFQYRKTGTPNKRVHYWGELKIYYKDGIQNLIYDYIYGCDSAGNTYLEYKNADGTDAKSYINVSTATTKILVSNKTDITRAYLQFRWMSSINCTLQCILGVDYPVLVEDKLFGVVEEIT